MHADKMYHITEMKHRHAQPLLWTCHMTVRLADNKACCRKLKFGLWCGGIVASGIVVPYAAVHWQMKKAAG